MDWREVRLEAISGSALFPGKPVEVSRTLQLGDAQNVVTLTLRSARIDSTVFAVGWVLDAGLDTREKLEAAMLANISAEVSMISRQAIQQSDRVITKSPLAARCVCGPIQRACLHGYGCGA